MLILRLFVSHSFNDHDHILDVQAFRSAVEQTCKEVGENLRSKSFSKIELLPYFEDVGLGKALPNQIRSEIIKSSLFMIDIAGATPNTFYELGFAHSRNKGLILLEAVRQGQAPKPIPADISDLLIGRYSSDDELKEKLLVRLLDVCSDLITAHQRTLVEGEDRCFWFQGAPPEIHVVCAPEPERTRFASSANPDYLYVDNLEDRDALFEVSNFLSRSYPNAKVFRHSSDALSADVFSSNVVVLGGPHNNSATRDLMKAVGASFEYADDENALSLKIEARLVTLRSMSDARNILENDVGYFGWFLNPFNRNNRVVMCHGCHTFGTLGASLAFSDNNLAIENVSLLKDIVAGDLQRINRFECIFHVPILENRRVITPKIDPDAVLAL